MAGAGLALWQVLPLGPVQASGSPYDAGSVFAGNPALLSPELLAAEGLLPRAADPPHGEGSGGRVSFEVVGPWKDQVLRQAWSAFSSAGAGHRLSEEYEAFLASPERPWLDGWATYAALRGRYHGLAWQDWEPALSRREPVALARAQAELGGEIQYHRFVQFLFERQWRRVRREASTRGVAILGDAPIYVALDSADVWTNPGLFQLDDDGRPTAVAGAPPDYFSETGQRWGNPLYRWDRLEANGFRWWIDRVRADLRRYDILRLDHFRGFVAYWAVPALEPTARLGRWEPGPGARLFDALRGALGDDLPLVAEDLGEITDDVRSLRDSLGLPGMRVLQFGLGQPESEHHPSRIPRNCVAYTGTHDNDTARGWFESLGAEARALVLADLGSDGREIHWDMIRACFATPAQAAVVPVQDVLGLGSASRMNVPAEPRGNWTYRLCAESLHDSVAERLRLAVVSTGRTRKETR